MHSSRDNRERRVSHEGRVVAGPLAVPQQSQRAKRANSPAVRDFATARLSSSPTSSSSIGLAASSAWRPPAPGVNRSRDKYISLAQPGSASPLLVLDEEDADELERELQQQQEDARALAGGSSTPPSATPPPTLFSGYDPNSPHNILASDDAAAPRGRITVQCVCDALILQLLQEAVEGLGRSDITLKRYSECLHMRCPGAQPSTAGGGAGGASWSAPEAPPVDPKQQQQAQPGNSEPWKAAGGAGGDAAKQLPTPWGDVLFFDYGVVVMWGLSEAQERSLLRTLTREAMLGALEEDEVQVDSLAVVYSRSSVPHIQNDTITISRRAANDVDVKLAISHALAQSTKLSVYERHIMDLVDDVRHLPQDMADHGYCSMSRRQVAQLLGRVFLQKSAVNLLSSVLDVPEYFWRVPDELQALYERACEYLELEDRIELVNARFEVLHKMLAIWHDHSNHTHLARLDQAIIWLIVVEVIMAFLQVVGYFRGVVAKDPTGGGGGPGGMPLPANGTLGGLAGAAALAGLGRYDL